MIDDFANQKWTWDHKLVDGNFFDRQWIDYTKAKCRPWLSQRDFGRSNQLAAGGWGAGRGPGSCWPNQRRPAVLPFESVTGGGKKHERCWWWSSKEISTVMYRVGSAFRRSIWSPAERVQIFWPGECFFEGRNRILWLQFGTQLSTQKKKFR